MNKRGFIVSIMVLILSILIVSTVYAYLRIALFDIEIKKKILILKIVDRKCKNLEYILLNIINETFFEAISRAVTNGLSKNDIEFFLNEIFSGIFNTVFSDCLVKKYLLVENASIKVSCSRPVLAEYEHLNLNETDIFLLADGKEDSVIDKKSICCIVKAYFAYSNSKYKISYHKNSSVVVCMLLRYLELYNLGKKIKDKLYGRHFMLECNESVKNILRTFFSRFSTSYNIEIKYSYQCETYGNITRCTLSFKIVDMYAKKQSAKFYYIKFSKVNFWAIYLNCSQ